MDRSTGTPLGFALLLLFALAFGWVVFTGPGHQHGGSTPAGTTTATDAAFATNRSPAELAAAEAQPALDWPDQMPGSISTYEGRRVSAFGLSVTGVDADEGFWVQKEGHRAWVQLQTSTESPYTVRVGDVVSLSGRVVPHNPDFPSKIFFCPGRVVSATELSRQPEHLAVLVNALSFGTG